jgi:hypothetical protein
MDKGFFQILFFIVVALVSVLIEAKKKQAKNPPMVKNRPRQPQAQPQPLPEAEEPPWWEAELKKLEPEVIQPPMLMEPEGVLTKAKKKGKKTGLELGKGPGRTSPFLQLRSLPGLKNESLTSISERVREPLITTRAELRKAILMSEIILPPLALRDPRATPNASTSRGT